MFCERERKIICIYDAENPANVPAMIHRAESYPDRSHLNALPNSAIALPIHLREAQLRHSAAEWSLWTLYKWRQKYNGLWRSASLYEFRSQSSRLKARSQNTLIGLVRDGGSYRIKPFQARTSRTVQRVVASARRGRGGGEDG